MREPAGFDWRRPRPPRCRRGRAAGSGLAGWCRRALVCHCCSRTVLSWVPVSSTASSVVHERQHPVGLGEGDHAVGVGRVAGGVAGEQQVGPQATRVRQAEVGLREVGGMPSRSALATRSPSVDSERGRRRRLPSSPPSKAVVMSPSICADRLVADDRWPRPAAASTIVLTCWPPAGCASGRVDGRRGRRCAACRRSTSPVAGSTVSLIWPMFSPY